MIDPELKVTCIALTDPKAEYIGCIGTVEVSELELHSLPFFASLKKLDRWLEATFLREQHHLNIIVCTFHPKGYLAMGAQICGLAFQSRRVKT